MKNPILAKILIILMVLALSLSSQAQKRKIPQNQSTLYKNKFSLYDLKFYREHIPLDGDSAFGIPFRQDSLYGFVDKISKRWLIEPRFSQVFAVYPEGAIVAEKDIFYKGVDGYGLVNAEGKYLIEPYFQVLFKEGDLYHGLISASDPSIEDMHSSFTLNMYFTKEGKKIIEFKSHDFSGFQLGEDYAWSRFGPDGIVFDRKGKTVYKFKVGGDKRFVGVFRNTMVFGEGAYKEPMAYTGYNVKDKELWRFKWVAGLTAVIKMSDSVFGILSEAGFLLLDKEHNILPYGIANGGVGFGFPGIFPQLNLLNRIPVEDFETNKTGYIDRKGKLIIPCIYSYAGDFKDGEAPVIDNKTHMLGFIDTNGTIVVPAIIPAIRMDEMELFGMTPSFSDGLCMIFTSITKVGTDGRTYYTSTINEDGTSINYQIAYYNRQGQQKLLLPDTVRLGGPFNSGRAAIMGGKNTGLGFMDTSGKIVIDMKYGVAAAGYYPFPQIVVPYFKGGYAYLKGWKGYLGKDGYEYFDGKQVADHYDFSH